MSRPLTTYAAADLGLPGALARAMTQNADRHHVTFGNYASRITIIVGLLVMLTLAVFGSFGSSVGQGLLEMAGLDAELAALAGVASSVMTIYGLAVAACGTALIASAALLADTFGFRSDRRYDLR